MKYTFKSIDKISKDILGDEVTQAFDENAGEFSVEESSDWRHLFLGRLRLVWRKDGLEISLQRLRIGYLPLAIIAIFISTTVLLI